MGKKWEAVAFEGIRIGDVIRCSYTSKDGTATAMTGTISFKGLATASTKDGHVIARASNHGLVLQRRVKKPKLPVEPGTVIDAVVVRSWRLDGVTERRGIRLIRGLGRWVGMEWTTGGQLFADDADIKEWTLVAAPRA
jgi:hypothetical protein